MIANGALFLFDLVQAALLGACFYVLCRAYVSALERFADSGCTCAKGRWNPECPVHGRRVAGEEPFPGANPW